MSILKSTNTGLHSIVLTVDFVDDLKDFNLFIPVYPSYTTNVCRWDHTSGLKLLRKYNIDQYNHPYFEWTVILHDGSVYPVKTYGDVIHYIEKQNEINKRYENELNKRYEHTDEHTYR